MNELPFPGQHFDLILSEGGIEYLSFYQRLDTWRPFLKHGGYLLLCEPCLLTDRELPDELYEYFGNQYKYKEPENIKYQLENIKNAGYKVCTRYTFPDNTWHSYFNSFLDVIKTLPGKKQNTSETKAIINDIEHQIYLYQTYKDYFAHIYFVIRKTPIINNESIYNKELSKLQRQQLENFLIEKLCDKECSSTLKYTQSWLTDNIACENHEAILTDFQSQGGYCDCEVLANVFHTILEDID